MPHDAATSASTKDRIATPPSGNKAAIAAVEAHHAELATQLRALTAAVLDAARTDDGGTARSRLHAWYREQLMPHIVAEELASTARPSTWTSPGCWPAGCSPNTRR